jgi:hypothetical protein
VKRGRERERGKERRRSTCGENSVCYIRAYCRAAQPPPELVRGDKKNKRER